MVDELKKKVETFWNENLCGKHFVNAPYPSKEFFEQYSKFRYRKEHHLDHLIDWQSAKGKDLLEIGVGIGTDGARWAQYSRSYTGIDLTDEAVIATKLNFKLLGVRGNILKADAERMPLRNDKFDIVYSHGVLHHTPDIKAALREIYRILKSDGDLILMLYSKDSFNYWIRIQFYFRIKLLVSLLIKRVGFKISGLWGKQIKNLEKTGWKYFSWNNWYHHYTDGPDCEIANIYHNSEIVEMLQKAGFSIEMIRKAHFPLGGKYPKLERFLGRYIGFYQFAWAKKV